MDDEAYQHEPVRPGADGTGANPGPDLLTVSQAYTYLIAQGLPRSKKTIRKWCRLGHVDWKEISVPGGAKWLVTRSSLDARIAEERLIDASLASETGPHRSERGRTVTPANGFEPVRDDALVEVLRDQLAHERAARAAAETKNRDLIDKYHEISLASAQMGIEIGKGMQEQAQVRRLTVRSEPEPSRRTGSFEPARLLEVRRPEEPISDPIAGPDDPDDAVDNRPPESGSHPL